MRYRLRCVWIATGRPQDLTLEVPSNMDARRLAELAGLAGLKVVSNDPPVPMAFGCNDASLGRAVNRPGGLPGHD